MDGARFAIVPAAGSGSRFGEAQPKQYRSLAGRTVLEHAVEGLARHPAIDGVFVVLAPGDQSSPSSAPFIRSGASAGFAAVASAPTRKGR